MDFAVNAGTRSAGATDEETPVTAPPNACVVTELTLLKSVVVDTQMLAAHPAGMMPGMLAPVRVTVYVAAAASAEPTVKVTVVAVTAAVAPKTFGVANVTPIVPER